MLTDYCQLKEVVHLPLFPRTKIIISLTVCIFPLLRDLAGPESFHQLFCQHYIECILIKKYLEPVLTSHRYSLRRGLESSQKVLLLTLIYIRPAQFAKMP